LAAEMRILGAAFGVELKKFSNENCNNGRLAYRRGCGCIGLSWSAKV